MAASEYLKSAAASLHQAANHLQRQARDMQASLTRLRADKHTLINKGSLKVKTSQVEYDAIQDEGKRSKLAIQIEKLQHEIMAAEQELKQAEKDLVDAAEAKLKAAMGIENQAKQLEDQATRID
jgi:hypothetical protein